MNLITLVGLAAMIAVGYFGVKLALRKSNAPLALIVLIAAFAIGLAGGIAFFTASGTTGVVNIVAWLAIWIVAQFGLLAFLKNAPPEELAARKAEAANNTETVAAARAAAAARLADLRRQPSMSDDQKPASAVNPRRAPPDVFISYKRDERPQIQEIARRLEALGLDVWFDADMQSGTAFDAEIERQVRGAKCVLVCWSPGAVASDWVRAEATIGRQRGVLAACILVDCDLPPPFNLVHAEDLRAGVSSVAWPRLLERIGALTGRVNLALQP